MIPPWEKVLDHAVELAGPFGSLHVADFGDQRDLPAWFRSALNAWLARFSVAPRLDLRARCDEAARRHGKSCEFLRLYRGYALVARLAPPAGVSP